MKLIKYNEVFTPQRGIFNYITLPIDTITTQQLNMYFFTNCGEKYLSPNVCYYVDENKSISDTDLETLGGLVVGLYSQKWQGLTNALEAEYNITDNYNHIESETINSNESIRGGENETDTKKVWGYDSSSSVNDEENVIASTNTNDTTGTRTRQTNRHGKTGGMSYQELIKDELRIRENNIKTYILNDVKKFTTMAMY